MRKNFKAELKKLREENEQLKNENEQLKRINFHLKSWAGLLERQLARPAIPISQYPPSSYSNPFWC